MEESIEQYSHGWRNGVWLGLHSKQRGRNHPGDDARINGVSFCVVAKASGQHRCHPSRGGRFPIFVKPGNLRSGMTARALAVCQSQSSKSGSDGCANSPLAREFKLGGLFVSLRLSRQGHRENPTASTVGLTSAWVRESRQGRKRKVVS